MILIDTSVWVAYLRGSDKRVCDQMHLILDEDLAVLAVPVKFELLGGCSAKEQPRLRRALEALPVLFPTNATWELIERWVERSGSKGERFGVADLLIAALASEQGAGLWALDKDFVRMQKLGFIKLHSPS
jgi:predicted nucleic acid-binding protein